MELLKLLARVSFKDNGEELVNLREVLKNARFSGKGPFLLRSTAAKKLIEAASFLPKNYCFKIHSAFRTRKEQESIWERTYEEVRRKHRKLPKSKVAQMTNAAVMPADGAVLPFHLTGGAIDLALVSPAGRKVEMINRNGDRFKEAPTDYPKLHKPIKRNRKILIDVMTKAGFVNYPEEWWHWSYGDHLWALLKNKPYAIYGPLEKKEGAVKQLKLI